MRPRHRLTFRVRSYETDPRGRLQVPILCKLMQEAATIHAEELGVSVGSLVDRGVAWVLTRLHLTMQQWPGAGDEVVIETWPEALNRLTTERRFTILDRDGNAGGTASTLWLVLDLARRRPIRIPAAIVEALGNHDLGTRPTRPESLQAPDPADHEVAFTVRRSDLDLAGHVNNTSYVDWVVEAVADAVWSGCELIDLDIDYLAECHLGQTIISSSQTTVVDGGFDLRHKLVRHEDEAEVVRARTLWRSVG